MDEEYDESVNDDIQRIDNEFCEQRIKEIEKVIENEKHIPINEDIKKLNRELQLIRDNLFHSFTFLEHQIHNDVDDIVKISVEINKKVIALAFLWSKVFDFDLIKQNYLKEYNDITEKFEELVSHINGYDKVAENRGSEDFDKWGSHYLYLRKYILNTIDKLIKYSN